MRLWGARRRVRAVPMNPAPPVTRRCASRIMEAACWAPGPACASASWKDREPTGVPCLYKRQRAVERSADRRGGGSAELTRGADMGIFSRFNRVLKSNLNNLVDKAEDPAKLINQTIIEMEAELKNARKELVQTLGTAKRLDKKRAEYD